MQSIIQILRMILWTVALCLISIGIGAVTGAASAWGAAGLWRLVAGTWPGAERWVQTTVVLGWIMGGIVGGLGRLPAPPGLWAPDQKQTVRRALMYGLLAIVLRVLIIVPSVVFGILLGGVAGQLLSIVTTGSSQNDQIGKGLVRLCGLAGMLVGAVLGSLISRWCLSSTQPPEEESVARKQTRMRLGS